MTDVREIVDPGVDVSPPLGARLLLAAMSAGAGAIYLAMVPSHWGASVAEGVGLAVAGWLLLAFAAVVLSRPSRGLLRFAIGLNVALITAWIVSRTSGLPFGARSGHARGAGFVDITCVVFEVVLVAACSVLLFRPRIGARFARGGVAVAGVASLGVLALTTGALASPAARNPVAHSKGGAAADAPTNLTPVDDKGFSLLHNGQHEHITIHSLDPQTTKALNAQLEVTRELATKTPTVAAAVKQGWQRVGPYFPGIGAHYWKGVSSYGGPATDPDGVIDDVSLRTPFMLIFNGTNPTSKIAGFMYYSTAPADPAGFAGRNDYWHYHSDLCIKGMSGGGVGQIDIPYGLDHSATPEQCAKVGGSILAQSGYMLHVWTVPGYEMTDNYGGVFGEANPKLTCADGTYYQLPLDDWAAHPLNICQNQ